MCICSTGSALLNESNWLRTILSFVSICRCSSVKTLPCVFVMASCIPWQKEFNALFSESKLCRNSSSCDFNAKTPSCTPTCNSQIELTARSSFFDACCQALSMSTQWSLASAGISRTQVAQSMHLALWLYIMYCSPWVGQRRWVSLAHLLMCNTSCVENIFARWVCSLQSVHNACPVFKKNWEFLKHVVSLSNNKHKITRYNIVRFATYHTWYKKTW